MAGLHSRVVAPEILDDLPESDPRAIASRRDLRLLNRLMLQDRIMATMLATLPSKPPRRILEIGCGDGSFMLAVARRLPRSWAPVELVLLDRQALVTGTRVAEFAKLGWLATVVQDDVCAWSKQTDGRAYDVVATNLFLHHFGNEDLARLLAAMAALAPVFLATEPLRTRLPLLASSMLWVIGANDVTRHDAPASVRAGFRGRDLSALWPPERDTTLLERRRGLFTHAFAALGSQR